MIFLIIITMIVTSMYILNECNQVRDSDYIMIKKDYEAKLGIEVLKLNFCYSIKESLEKSIDGNSFLNQYLSFDRNTFIDIVNQKYFEDSRCKLKTPGKDSVYPNISNTGDFVEFYMIVEYNDSTSLRVEAFKCRIYNPYKVFGEDKINSLVNDDYKKLFKILR